MLNTIHVLENLQDSKHQIEVYFKLIGFEEAPGELTETIGISPSKVILKGQPFHPGSPIPAKENMWILKSPLAQNNAPMEEQLEVLITMLKPQAAIVRKYGETCYCEFSFIFFVDVDTNESTPPIHLDRESIRFIGYLNASCDFDVILVSDIPSEEDIRFYGL